MMLLHALLIWKPTGTVHRTELTLRAVQLRSAARGHMAMSEPTKVMWRKSSASETNQCVEVAFVEHQVLIRSSLDPSGPTLAFSMPEWTAVDGG